MVLGCPEMSKMGVHFSMLCLPRGKHSNVAMLWEIPWCHETQLVEEATVGIVSSMISQSIVHLPCSMTIQETAPHQQLLAGGMPALTLSPPWYGDLASLLPLASYVHWPSICAVSTILVVLWLLPLCSIIFLISMLFAKVGYIIIYLQK